MELQEIKSLVAETGRMLLEEKLVARTWGNVSARVSVDSFAVSPSGLDYLQTTPEDIVLVHMGEELTYEGSRKPSSEKGIHAAAYAAFPDAGFVIHTHQDYASAISVAGFESLEITEEERMALGGIALAGYGLPGTKKLKEHVAAEFKKGAATVLMAHHGVVIVGTDRDDAFRKATLLEEICKRNIKGQGEETASAAAHEVDLLGSLLKTYPHLKLLSTPETLAVAERGISIPAQLDDMAQIIGSRIPVAKNSLSMVEHALEKSDAVIVKNFGILVNAADEDDREALMLLAEKSAITKLHADALGVKGTLSWFDCLLMRVVYKMKYSKKKDKAAH